MTDKDQDGIDMQGWTALITLIAVVTAVVLGNVYGLEPDHISGVYFVVVSWLWNTFLDAVSSGLFWSGLVLGGYVGWKLRGEA